MGPRVFTRGNNVTDKQLGEIDDLGALDRDVNLITPRFIEMAQSRWV
jgi:hypothetical protein